MHPTQIRQSIIIIISIFVNRHKVVTSFWRRVKTVKKVKSDKHDISVSATNSGNIGQLRGNIHRKGSKVESCV